MVAVRAGVDELRRDLAGVHDARVALRRLRATLAVFADLLSGIPEGLPADLRWFAGQVSGTRDAEVVASRLESGLAGAADRAAAAALAAALDRRTEEARSAARAALSHPRTDAMLASLGRLHLEAPPSGEIHGDLRAHLLVLGRLEALSDDLPAVVRVVSTSGIPRRRRARLLHAQRKQVKTARAVTPLLETTSADRSRLNRSLRRVQELLGEHHDAVVTRSWLAGVAEADPVVRELTRELRQRELAEMTGTEDRLPRAVDRLVRRVEEIRRTSARSAR